MNPTQVFRLFQSHAWKVAGVAFALLALNYIFGVARTYWRLRQFPGPRGAGFSKLWMMKATAAGRMYLDLAEACQKYGSLVRIGPNDLVTDNAELIRQINGLRSPYARSEWYAATAFSHEINHVFCERDDTLHAERRNKLIPSYSGRDNDSLEQRMDDRIVDLCNLIRRKYNNSSASDFKPVDLALLASYFTLDVIYTLAFGDPMGFLTEDKDLYNYLANQKAILPIFEWLSTLPGLEQFLRTKWISKRIMPKKTDPTGVGLLLKFAEQAIAKRRAEKQRDMLGSFLEHGLTDAEAEQEAVVQIIAGADTTATAIRMTLFFIMTSPNTYTRLRAEIDVAEAAGKISFPVIQDTETRTLPFLEACVKEGLRTWPPVMGLMSKAVPAEGATLLGKFVPGGTNIGYCGWGIHRNKETFGPDADIYRPERWIEAAADENAGEKLSEMNKTVDLVFGWGKNACLGKPIAQIEMRKTVAELFRRFDMSIVNPEHPFNSVGRNGLFIQDSMFVRFEERVK